MLGSTAGGLFWMFRFLERSENTARLLEAGFRMALTRSSDAAEEWSSVVTTAGARNSYMERHGEFDGDSVTDFLLRDRTNPSSVLSVVEQARNNGRKVRTALTREVWEAINDCWMNLHTVLKNPIDDRDLPKTLGLIRQESANVRGALHGTMLRNDIYDFARLGTFIERADNTARILDVKYYVLLPSMLHVGSRLDNAQWETILRSLSAQRSYLLQNGGGLDPRSIAELGILDRRMPRSLAFCYAKIGANLGYLAAEYCSKPPSHDLASQLQNKVADKTIQDIFEIGLHEFLLDCIEQTSALANRIEIDYRFQQ